MKEATTPSTEPTVDIEKVNLLRENAELKEALAMAKSILDRVLKDEEE